MGLWGWEQGVSEVIIIIKKDPSILLWILKYKIIRLIKRLQCLATG